KMGPLAIREQVKDFFEKHLTGEPAVHGSGKIEGRVELQIAAGSNPEARAILGLPGAVLEDLAAAQLAGPAPKGPLERQISSL
ncbi:unnamed protein product, partial [Prorocentrum cordatum]